jgi:hypothetical protein
MPTDQEILAMDNVPPRMAAKYLGAAALSVYYALQQKAAPYGYAVKNPGGKYAYQISPGLLVAYKRGTLRISIGPEEERNRKE